MPEVFVTVTIEKEQLSTGEDIFVAQCVELDLASQGTTVEEAKNNLKEAITLWIETASPSELEENFRPLLRHTNEVYTTRIEVPYGQIAGHVGA